VVWVFDNGASSGSSHVARVGHDSPEVVDPQPLKRHEHHILFTETRFPNLDFELNQTALLHTRHLGISNVCCVIHLVLGEFEDNTA